MLKYFLLLCVLTGCTSTPLINDGEYITNQATLINQLPVDGCDWHFVVNIADSTAQYVANSKSQPKVDAIINAIQTKNPNGLYSASVNLNYKLTGNKKKVQCGWNTMREMDEIEVKEIKLQ